MRSAMPHPVELSQQVALSCVVRVPVRSIGNDSSAPLPHPLSLLRYRQAMAEYGPHAAQELIGVALPPHHLPFSSTSD